MKGQMLIEVVVIVGIVVLLVLGVVAGTTRVLSQTQTVQNQTAALGFAQEGIELTRQLRDTNWTTLLSYGAVKTTYCVGSDGMFTPIALTCPPNVGKSLYTREITLELVPSPDGSGGETMQVTVTVSWNGAARANNSVTLTTYVTERQ